MTATSIQAQNLKTLNTLPEERFVGVLGGIFEHSAWVPQQIAARRPFDSLEALYRAMVEQIESAGRAAQLKLIRAHPELAGKAAIRGELTPESTSEQAGAGLDQCSEEEFNTLTQLNTDYQQKFGFPFIVAVRGYDRAGIIAEFQRRLGLSTDDEMAESLRQIYKIGRFRLEDLLANPAGVGG